MLLVSLILAGAGLPQAPPEPEPLTVAYDNARWYDGEGFVAGTRYAVGATLRAEAPGEIDLRVDLNGQWVVPPYGEAHTHLLERETIDTYVDFYLRRGVFYALDQASMPLIRNAIADVLARPDTPDYRSPNQGFTGPGGHPLQIVQQVQGLGLLPAAWTAEDIDGKAVFVVESVEEVDEVWPGFLAGGPDFVKIFLLYSEVHEERSGDPRYLYRCGLDPALARPIVERAHAAGLEVSAHVYSRADFRTAVEAGVDMIAHFPGVGHDQELGDAHFLLTEEDAELAGQAGVEVCTTLSTLAGAPGPVSASARALVDRIVVPNLDLLSSAGVPLLVGSDLVRMTSDVEARTLLQLELFDPATLLYMWCVETPRRIFPGRRIGRLRDGYEASFLVLEGDPLEDFENTQRIALRVKQGRMLFPANPSFPPFAAPGGNRGAAGAATPDER